MVPLAGRSTPRDLKKLSDIPEEVTEVIPPPLQRLRSTRKAPTPPRPTALLKTPSSSPNPDFENSVEQLELYDQGKKLYQRGMGWLKRGKSGVAEAEGCFRSAYEIFVDVQRLDKATAALGQLCWCRGTLAHRNAKAKNYDAALQGYEETRMLYGALAEMLPLKKAEDARAKEARALFEFGVVSAEVKDVIGATAALKEAAQLFGDIRHEAEEAMCFCELASLISRRDPQSALHYYRSALLIFCKLGDSTKEARALYSIGSLAATHARDFATGFAYFVQARVIFRRLDASAEAADCSYELGKLAAKARQLSAAVSYFEEASDLYHAVNRPVDEAWCYYRIALALRKLDSDDDPDPKRADLPIDYLSEARTLFREAGDGDAEASTLMRLGELLRDVDASAAKTCLVEALDMLESDRDARVRRSTAVLQQLEEQEKPNTRSAKSGKAWWAAA